MLKVKCQAHKRPFAVIIILKLTNRQRCFLLLLINAPSFIEVVQKGKPQHANTVAKYTWYNTYCGLRNIRNNITNVFIFSYNAILENIYYDYLMDRNKRLF